jgi:hypothetical protein
MDEVGYEAILTEATNAFEKTYLEDGATMVCTMQIEPDLYIMRVGYGGEELPTQDYEVSIKNGRVSVKEVTAFSTGSTERL